MNTINTQKLYEAFPQLYRGRNLRSSESSMVWRFECDNGWIDLMWNLSHAIEEEALSRGLKPQSKDWPQATQIKQKFGSLRFHLSEYTDATRALIEQARMASTEICEVCGALASSIGSARRQVKTVCQDHTDEIQRNAPPVKAAGQLPVWKLMKD